MTAPEIAIYAMLGSYVLTIIGAFGLAWMLWKQRDWK
jgi:hypothetical protein